MSLFWKVPVSLLEFWQDINRLPPFRSSRVAVSLVGIYPLQGPIYIYQENQLVPDYLHFYQAQVILITSVLLWHTRLDFQDFVMSRVVFYSRLLAQLSRHTELHFLAEYGQAIEEYEAVSQVFLSVAGFICLSAALTSANCMIGPKSESVPLGSPPQWLLCSLCQRNPGNICKRKKWRMRLRIVKILKMSFIINYGSFHLLTCWLGNSFQQLRRQPGWPWELSA